MKILLLAMPDAANNFQRIIRVPNLGLCSMAAHLPGHDVRVVDLVLVHRGIRRWLSNYLQDFQPDVIGISSMTFQFPSALEISAICRRCCPNARVAVGGYHVTLEFAALSAAEPAFDFLIRGEGEHTFARLIDALENGRGFGDIPGLSWRRGRTFIHNAPGMPLDLSVMPLPDRSVRVLDTFSYFGRKLDCVETSRGCTRPCTFCSISAMYGSSFRCHAIGRVVADLCLLRERGVETVLLVDDNITLDPARFKELARAILEHGLNCMEYIVQASVEGIVADPELIPALARANFRLVFLGIESVLPRNLLWFRKGNTCSKTAEAVRLLREHQIAVMGGFIVGNPEDTRDDVRTAFRAARELHIDLPYVQCVTPYPGTPLREALLREGLVTNLEDLTRYTGFICNVRTRHLSQGQLSRLMNWENLKFFFDPRRLKGNMFVSQRRKGVLKVLLNNLELIRGWFTGDQFRSRHSF